MNVKNKVKKVFAVAASAALVGTTIAAVAAYDLSDYPAPFVEDGMFNGAIVVGETAATTDVLGAIDIAASLQAEATTPVATGGATATTTIQGGVLFEDNLNQDLNFNDSITDLKFDDQDLDVLVDG
ncbi:MAG: S-layer protein, partial [Patescibacteria group bacterium]|nr:S-layer protein [Patescibacteria group bacterium]